MTSLNTGHFKYNKISRALSADPNIAVLRALDGGADTPTQAVNHVISRGIAEATWTTAGQGIERTDTNWYSVTTASFKKYDLDNNVIYTNSDPFANLPVGINHLGDGFVDGGLLVLPASDWDNANKVSLQACIVKFNISDGSYHSHIDYTATLPAFGASSLCLSLDGTEILGCSYTIIAGNNPANTDVHRFHKTTGAVLGKYTLSTPSIGIQGLSPHVDDNYYVNSHNKTDDINEIYVYDNAFQFLSIINPSSSLYEMEGITSNGGNLYFNMSLRSPRIINLDNMWLYSDSVPVKFLDSSLIGDEGTILMKVELGALFNYNTLIDSVEYGNDWESWVYETGELGWRVNSANKTSITGLVAQQDYIIAYAWKRTGSTVEIKNAVDGVYTAPVSGTWVAPPSGGLYIGGKNASNFSSNIIYKKIILIDEYLSNVDGLEIATNFGDLFDEGNNPSLVRRTKTLSISTSLLSRKTKSIAVSTSLLERKVKTHVVRVSLLSRAKKSLSIAASLLNRKKTSLNVQVALLSRKTKQFIISTGISNKSSKRLVLSVSALERKQKQHVISSQLLQRATKQLNLSTELRERKQATHTLSVSLFNRKKASLQISVGLLARKIKQLQLAIMLDGEIASAVLSSSIPNDNNTILQTVTNHYITQ